MDRYDDFREELIASLYEEYEEEEANKTNKTNKANKNKDPYDTLDKFYERYAEDAKMFYNEEGLNKLKKAVEEFEGDEIFHPSHYNQGKFEVWDVIEDWNLDFFLGNVIKYIARAGHKGDALEDLKKAQNYLDEYIERIEKRNEK